MIDTPTPNTQIPVIFDSKAVSYTNIDETQSTYRVSVCKICEKSMFISGINRCLSTGLDINLMTTVNELSCPLEKW